LPRPCSSSVQSHPASPITLYLGFALFVDCCVSAFAVLVGDREPPAERLAKPVVAAMKLWEHASGAR
jgi:hypothetical protein